MIVIILASGVGKRLRPITNTIPKSLIKINHQTILEYQLDIIARTGIKKIIITTGHFEDKVRNVLKNGYENLDIKFVLNQKYNSTNYIYSLWLTKNYIDEDILLFHGDLIFSENLLRKMLKIKGNVVPVNNKIKAPDKDFKAVIRNQKVIKIGVNFFGENTFFSLPMYKFSKNDFLLWMNEIENEIKKGNLNIYAEDALNKISDKITLKPFYFNKEFCMEIDTFEDMAVVKKNFN